MAVTPRRFLKIKNMTTENLVKGRKEVKGCFVRENGRVIFKPNIKGNFTLIYIDETIQEIPQSPLFFVDHP